MRKQFYLDKTEEFLGEPLKSILAPLIADHCTQYQSVKARFSAEFKPKRHSFFKQERPQSISLTQFQHLPTSIVPKHYVVELKPYLEEFTFKGIVSIDICVKIDTSTVVLNVLDIDIITAEIILNCDVAQSRNISYSVPNETATITLDRELPAGTLGTLVIRFLGELNDQMKGFYRCKCLSKSGEERYGAVTQFEATHARRCFPCWDEPAIKATFDIVLIVPVDHVALSNMPIDKVELVGRGLRRIDFRRTPKMSAYLVAIVVGEYDRVEAKSEDGVIVRVFTPVDKKEHGFFALDVATKMLSCYKNFFNVAYALPKLDLVAISEFYAGSMGSWGLVICHETNLLIDPEQAFALCKQSVALTIGHEIAHQWFGNLVTMEWWTYLWLYEGFVSFAKYLCVDHLFPEYEIHLHFMTDLYTRALELDSLENNHAIDMPVKHPCEVDEVFDEISYNKAAAVLRMLYYYIGEKNFRRGMKIFLTRHENRNTCTEDLWAALEQASGKFVAEIMRPWIKAKGYPIVQVSSKQIKSKKRLLKLTQNEFLAGGRKPKRNYTWIIPISVCAPTSTVRNAKTFLFHEKSMEVIIDNVGMHDWVKLNPGSVGFFRTQYSTEMLEELMLAVERMELPPTDRLGLIDDIFAMVQAEQATMAIALKLIASYRNETNYAVWRAITNALKIFHVLISHTELVENFDQFGERLYRPIAENLGWDEQSDENHFDTFLRHMVLSRLVTHRCRDFVTEAQKRFHLHLEGTELLPTDLLSTCYRAILQDGNDEVYNKMLTLYRSAELSEDQDRILIALGCNSNEVILRKALKFALAGEVNAEGTVSVISGVALNPKGRYLAWEYFKNNSQELFDLCHNEALLERLLKNLIENFATEAQALEVEEFFKSREFPGTEHIVSKLLKIVRLNEVWLKRDLEPLTEYLLQYKTK